MSNKLILLCLFLTNAYAHEGHDHGDTNPITPTMSNAIPTQPTNGSSTSQSTTNRTTGVASGKTTPPTGVATLTPNVATEPIVFGLLTLFLLQ